MKAFLITLLGVLTLGLCGICLVQWQREFILNAKIDELIHQLIAENKIRLEFEEKAFRFEQEIARLTTLRAETEAALLDATEKLQQQTLDQSARGFSIAVLMNEVMVATTELSAYKQLAGKGTDAVKDRNQIVGAQNAAIEKANTTIKHLATERDEVIVKLNARTQEFNELVEKYNKLSKAQ